jgi:mannose/cellobiose epimerase-like protein (N-acyl-D-glucosamine 2-epimerase family)
MVLLGQKALLKDGGYERAEHVTQGMILLDYPDSCSVRYFGVFGDLDPTGLRPRRRLTFLIQMRQRVHCFAFFESKSLSLVWDVDVAHCVNLLDEVLDAINGRGLVVEEQEKLGGG